MSRQLEKIPESCIGMNSLVLGELDVFTRVAVDLVFEDGNPALENG